MSHAVCGEVLRRGAGVVARVGLSWFPAGIAPRSQILVLLSHWKAGGGAAVLRAAL